MLTKSLRRHFCLPRRGRPAWRPLNIKTKYIRREPRTPRRGRPMCRPLKLPERLFNLTENGKLSPLKGERRNSERIFQRGLALQTITELYREESLPFCLLYGRHLSLREREHPTRCVGFRQAEFVYMFQGGHTGPPLRMGMTVDAGIIVRYDTKNSNGYVGTQRAVSVKPDVFNLGIMVCTILF